MQGQESRGENILAAITLPLVPFLLEEYFQNKLQIIGEHND